MVQKAVLACLNCAAVDHGAEGCTGMPTCAAVDHGAECCANCPAGFRGMHESSRFPRSLLTICK